jgi:Uma2 family endonuclease
MAAGRPHTIEDLWALTHASHVYELLDGVLVQRLDVGGRQGEIQGNVGARLYSYARPRGLGLVLASSTIYVLGRDPDTGLKPDVSFLRRERVPTGEAFERPLEIPPDLLVEVVHPDDRGQEINEKFARYRRSGVPLIWVLWLNPPRVFVLAAHEPPRELGLGDELDGGDVLPGFRVPVGDLFELGQ